MKNISLARTASLLTALALAALPACKPGQVSSPGGKPSTHFPKVNKHLDLGGDFFCYVDIDGDVQKLIDFLTDLVGMVEKTEELEFTSNDFKGVAEELGFQRIVAGGASSLDLGDGRYRNSFYLHIPEGRSGFLNLLGGKAAPFKVLDLAPEGSDLVLERELDLVETLNLVERVVGRIGKDKGRAAFQMAVAEAFKQAPVSYEELLPLLHTRITVIAKMDTEKRLQPPAKDAPSLPLVDFLFALDNMGPLLPKALAKGGEEAKKMLQQAEGVEMIEMPIPPVPGDFAIYRPVIAHHKKSGRLIMASRKAFLEACVKSGSKLKGDKAFKAAAKGIPLEGNGMFYLSERTFKEIRGLFEQAVQSDAASRAEAAMAMQLLSKWIDIGGSGIVAVQANLPEGILMKANAPFSLKRGILLQPVTFAAIAASMTIPVLSKVKGKAEATRDMSNLRQLSVALKVYAMDHAGAYPDRLEKLVDTEIIQSETLLFWKNPNNGQLMPWMYVEGLNDSSPGDAILLASPRPYRDGKRAVAFNDGSCQFIPEEQFQLMLESQKAAAPDPDPVTDPVVVPDPVAAPDPAPAPVPR